MPDLSTLLPFYIAVLMIQLSPGPDMMLVIARGIGQGPRTAFLSAVGMTLLSGPIQIAALVLGVASLFQTSPLAFEILRWAGAVYLIWLGTKILIGAGRVSDRAASRLQTVPAGVALREGMINNLTNPKPMMFIFAFLPQFVDPTSEWSVTMQLLVLGAIQKVSGFVILGAVALAAGAIGGWLARRRRLITWQERFTGVVMIGLGLRMALAGDARPVRVS